MGDSDARKAQRESRELHSMVRKAFEDPSSLEPRLAGTSRRAVARLWAQPSFGDHMCWTVWGPAPKPDPQEQGLVRRIVWRLNVDLEDRVDPVRRLALLNESLRPTLEVTDGSVIVSEFSRWVSSMPGPASLGDSVARARGVGLDGERLRVELESGDLLCRYEWWSGDRNWTPAEPAFDAIARWSIEFRDWLDSLLGT